MFLCLSCLWCLADWETKKEYPNDPRLRPCANHSQVLAVLNDIANAFKHSFVQSDMSFIGRDEPYVLALGLHRNKLASGTKFNSVPLKWLVEEFSAFYKEGIDWLRSFSERHR